MSNSFKKSFWLFAFLFFIALPFHNCTVDKNIRFTDASLSKISDSLRSESNGSGGAYLGKPIEGEYIRKFPSYLCQTSPVGEQGQLLVKNDIKIISDNCNMKDIQFNFTDAVVNFSDYNQDYLAVGSSIYELKKTSLKDFPVTEVWCSTKQKDFNLDVVTKVDNLVKSAKAKIYLSINKKARQTELFEVDRSVEDKTLTYFSKSLTLKVDKPLSSNQLSSGHFETMVDDTFFSGDLNCRVTSSAPIEDMGTALTTLSPLNSFITDQQESLCGHAGIIACDNLEDRTSAADLGRAKSFNLGWQWEPGGYNISNVSFDGSKSFEAINAVNGSGTGSIGFPFPATSEIYVRYYAKWSANFVFSPQSTGLFSINGSNGSLTMTSVFDRNHKLNFNMGSGSYTSNFQPNTNEWYCLEVHLKSASSQTIPDGVAEMWVNGNKIIESPPLALVDTMYVWAFYGNWYCADADNNSICDNPADTHPKQSIFYDNIVIAKQRVGCF